LTQIKWNQKTSQILTDASVAYLVCMGKLALNRFDKAMWWW
jgi:hypothetical protein